MALSRKPGVPHKGWKLSNVIDLHEEEGLEFGEYEDCEFCDQEQIRFVHLLRHDEFVDEIRVGCICACNLTNDYVEPKKRERLLRNRASRRARFPTRAGWRQNRQGGKTIKLQGHRITVGLKHRRFRVWIDGTEGRRYYDEEKTAMLRAFDYIQKIEGS